MVDRVDDLRRHLARADALALLCALAIPTGLFAGAVVISFRLISEWALVWPGILPGLDRYEALPPAWRFGLPAIGALAIGLVFQALPGAMRAVGPAHVMACLVRHGGRMPWPNAVLQFVGGSASIISGHSVGREGPVIHVGAASASLLGQWLRLPNNSIRTLLACGVAAAIAASFNTPLAGVIFAMEVVMLSYTLIGFAPVIVAAVSATGLSHVVFGGAAAFQIPPLHLVSLLELPWVLLLGAVIGCLAAGYGKGILGLDRLTRPWPIAARMSLAGVLVGAIGLVIPEVMGLGFDTVEAALLGHLGLTALATIAVAKLVATIACAGLALPGGVIGPMLVIGATAGGAIGQIGAGLVPELSAPHAFYATLGAVAMMGACLQAPLAALAAILELTGNPNTILPGMAAVMAAFLITRIGFHCPPLFVGLLRSRGIDVSETQGAIVLEQTGVEAVFRAAPTVVEWPDAAPGRAAAALPAVPPAAPAPRVIFAHRGVVVGTGRPDAGSPDPLVLVALHATLGEARRRLLAAGATAAIVVPAEVVAAADQAALNGRPARPLPLADALGLVEVERIEALAGT